VVKIIYVVVKDPIQFFQDRTYLSSGRASPATRDRQAYGPGAGRECLAGLAGNQKGETQYQKKH